MYGLRNGDAFPGLVTDDTGIFTAARQHGLAVEAFDVLLPEPAFQFFVAALGKRNSKVSIRMVSPTATETVTPSRGSRGSGCRC